MNPNESAPSSRLFLVRVWVAQDPDGAAGWRGKIQSLVDTGATTFSDWGALVTWLEAHLGEMGEPTALAALEKE